MCNNLTDFNIGDVSGNNTLDIAFISNNDFLWGLVYNDGTGNFSSPEYYDLSFPPVDIACGDLNNDGRADVVICGSDTEVYFSNETGFQQLVLTTTLSHDVLISDFDNDGDSDIITHTTFVYPNHRVYFFENLGNNQFFEHDYFQFLPFCSYAQIADLNNDSLPDMVFIESFGEGLQIFYNQGAFQLADQKFIPVTFPSLQRLACGDLDNNNFQDIAITHSQGSQEMYVKLLFNDGNGNFVDDPLLHHMK
ncbi:MAG: VCBS repeat-containing protein [Bacteroidales bacterium]